MRISRFPDFLIPLSLLIAHRVSDNFPLYTFQKEPLPIFSNLFTSLSQYTVKFDGLLENKMKNKIINDQGSLNSNYSVANLEE